MFIMLVTRGFLDHSVQSESRACNWQDGGPALFMAVRHSYRDRGGACDRDGHPS